MQESGANQGHGERLKRESWRSQADWKAVWIAPRPTPWGPVLVTGDRKIAAERRVTVRTGSPDVQDSGASQRHGERRMRESWRSQNMKKSKVSFEEALEELEAITRSLEEGNLSLDDSIKAYERGMELRAIAMEMLNAAEKKLEYLAKKEDGTVERRPIDMDEARSGMLFEHQEEDER